MAKPLNVRELIDDAYRNRSAVAAMNANGATYDIARAILEAAEEEDTPVIIQAYEHNIGYRGFRYFVELVTHLAENIRIPYAIALDHGTSVDSIVKAVHAGFTGVMLDNTAFELPDYQAACRELRKYLAPVNVSLEAEIGRMAPQEELQRGTLKTDIEAVEMFIRQAKVDLLAVSVGTSHGIHDLQNEIDYELINSIRNRTDVPLVMHGTSGVPLPSISRIVQAGMRKINFGESFRVDYIRHYNRFAKELKHEGHTWKIMQAVKDALRSDMREILRAVNMDLQKKG